METRTLRTADDFKGLSYYTMVALARAAGYTNPRKAIPARGEVWVLDLDDQGNYVRAEFLGRSLPVEAGR